MAKKALLTVDGTYRKIKKGFLTLTTLTNLLPTPSAWSLSDVSVVTFDGFGETFVFNTGVVAMASVSLDPPVAGHKYYARCMYMTDAGFSCGDGRFEYFYTDGANMVFQSAVGNDTAGAVITESAILSLPSVASDTGWQMRNFIVSGTTTAYRAQPILIDLTAACGAGNEPSKQWCDANIPYFVGTIGMKIPNVTAGAHRKIKKAFMTIGGVYRPCWSDGGELAYYGTITPLSVERYQAAAASVGDYALFCGGRGAWNNSSNDLKTTVDSYNKTLTRGTPTALSGKRAEIGATTIGNYALFAGGSIRYLSSNSADRATKVVDAYDTALTRSTPTSLTSARKTHAAVSVGNYALFGGGTYYSSGWNNYTSVEVYDASLSKLSNATTLSRDMREPAGASVGNYALFTYYAKIDAYDASLTKTALTDLSVSSMYRSGASVGDYALFVGGETTSSSTAIAYAYDKSLTVTAITPLSAKVQQPTTTRLANYAIVAKNDLANAYDESLTMTIIPSVSTARAGMAATSIGDYALFGGGDPNDLSYTTTVVNTVDAYTVG